ncbi:MAG: hypothetical protein ACRDZW_02520, partial [Acidimicrobiales bacterium]
MSLSVSLSVTECVVEPGGSSTCEVRVTNRGAEVDTARVAVTGPAAPWSWVVPPESTLEPGADGIVHIGFRLPRASEPPAGPVAFTVVVASRTRPDDVAEVEGTVRVAAFRQVSVVLSPADVDPLTRTVVVTNLGNVAVRAMLRAADADAVDEQSWPIEPAELDIEPGRQSSATVTLPPAGRSRSQPALEAFVVSATPEGGEAVTVRGSVDVPRAGGAGRSRPTRVIGAVVALALVGLLLRLTVLSPQDQPQARVATAPPSTGVIPVAENPACPAEGHEDRRVTGLTPNDIPLLPPDYSFLHLAQDGCRPIRWNPCESIHYVINPASAPPTGVADVREGFSRIAAATGMTFVDDGLTDEAS